MIRYFPRVQPSDISIRQIDSHDHILSAFDRSIAAYATDHFRRSGIDLILNCRVCCHDLNILPSCFPMHLCMSVAVKNCALKFVGIISALVSITVYCAEGKAKQIPVMRR